MRKNSKRRLTRPVQPLPAAVRRILIGRGLISAYRERPAYQQNDYLAWIRRARLDETKQRRLLQMLSELAAGDRYMRMLWRPRPNRLRKAPKRL